MPTPARDPEARSPMLGARRKWCDHKLAAAASLAALVVTTPGGAQAPNRPDGRVPAPTFADPDRAAKLAAAYPEIDRLVREFAASRQAPGVALGVIVDGKVAHVFVHGIRELGDGATPADPHGEPVERDTVFRIASMSKSFAAAAILQLRDAGKLALDDPAERYVPELASLDYPTTDSPRITIRHLLTHSAGFPEDNPWGDQQLAITDQQMSELMRRGIPFSTAPGTAYEYSNYGFAILGRIVANVAGTPYSRYLREHILLPLGLTSTTLEAASVPPERLAHGYRLRDGHWLEEPQLPDGAFGPMGGVLTSIDDLARWVAFLLDAFPPRDGPDDGPLRRASRREMQQVARYNGASATLEEDGDLALSAGGYGYGLGVRQTCELASSVSHSGGLPGFGSLMRWLPDYGVGIVALGNLTYTGWGAVVEEAFAALAATGSLQPRVPQPSPVLLERRDQVSRLVVAWDDALAEELAAMNLYRDEPKERRRAAIAKVRDEAGGACRNEGPLFAENALRGQWRMRCRHGDLRVRITLAPTEPAKVQLLDVRPIAPDESLAPPPVCRGS